MFFFFYSYDGYGWENIGLTHQTIQTFIRDGKKKIVKCKVWWFCVKEDMRWRKDTHLSTVWLSLISNLEKKN